MSETPIGFSKLGHFTSAFIPVVKVSEARGGKNGFAAIVYQCRMNTDWDGSPTAYGFNNPRDARPAGLVWNSKQEKYAREREDHFQRQLRPLEAPELMGSLRDATNNVKGGQGLFFDHNFQWVGVVSASPGEAKTNNIWIDDRAVLKDSLGKFPVIQKDGPMKGYYVSQSGSSAISASQKASTPGFKFLQSSYWNAAATPYCVWPSKMGHGVSLGDFGLAISHETGRSGGFFFGDTGSTTKVGECSGNLTTTVLGSPQNNSGMVSFLVFPRSGGGSATPGQETRINGYVRGQVSKLAGDPNAEEFIRFLAMGADPDTFGKSSYDSIKSGSRASTYETIRRALREWGFQSARKPIDANAPLER